MVRCKICNCCSYNLDFDVKFVPKFGAYLCKYCRKSKGMKR